MRKSREKKSPFHIPNHWTGQPVLTNGKLPKVAELSESFDVGSFIAEIVTSS